MFLTRQKQDLKWNFPSSVLCFLIGFWTWYSIPRKVTPDILHLSHLSSSGFLIACMFDEMGLDIHSVESRQTQKLILVYHKNHLIQAKILFDDSLVIRVWH